MRLIDRLSFFLDAQRRREITIDLAPVTVPDADLDLFEIVQDIELGHGDLVDPVDTARIFHEQRVEPAAAAGTARGRRPTRRRCARLVW